jgi:hypothetical protein
MKMKLVNEWKVNYAFRKNGVYKEAFIMVSAGFIYGALEEADKKLVAMCIDEGWDVYNIWNVGIMGDADEEVLNGNV